MSNLIEIYNSNGETQIQVTFDNETVWLSLNQISKLFDRDKSLISRYLSNIFKEKELEESTTVAKNATVQIEGNRSVKRETVLYNLDVIISVGYRINSKQGTQCPGFYNANGSVKQIRGKRIDDSGYYKLDQQIKRIT